MNKDPRYALNSVHTFFWERRHSSQACFVRARLDLPEPAAVADGELRTREVSCAAIEESECKLYAHRGQSEENEALQEEPTEEHGLIGYPINIELKRTL